MGSVRRAVLAIAVVAVCGAIAACGGSSAPSAAVRSSEPVTVITKAQASAYARAVNLQAGDLPNMTIAAPESDRPDAKRVGKIERCAGDLLAKRIVASIRSATFSGATEAEHETIKSVVEVMPSVALAEQNHVYTSSQRALACAERFLPSQIAGKGRSHIRFGPVTVARTPFPLPGVPGGFGYRISVTVLGTPSTIEAPHVYVDAFGFLSGPAEIALTATGFPQPVPEEADEHLLSLLAGRAAAHKL
jgi:hypothetical protein